MAGKIGNSKDTKGGKTGNSKHLTAKEKQAQQEKKNREKLRATNKKNKDAQTYISQHTKAGMTYKNGSGYHVDANGKLVKDDPKDKDTITKSSGIIQTGSADLLTKTTSSGFHYSGQSYGHVAFLWGDEYVNLRINPQSYQFSSPQRTSTFKTQSTPVVEDFGQDLETITFSGNTGGNKIDADGNNGEDRFRALHNLIVSYQQSTSNGNHPQNELTFFNNMDTGKPSYTVHIPQQGFQYSRDSQSPLLYNYAISLIVLKRASQPDTSEIAKSANGNQANNTDNSAGTNASPSTTTSASSDATQAGAATGAVMSSSTGSATSSNSIVSSGK